MASTIPIPSGLFIPVLKMGAAYGRLVGELMHSTFPDGISFGEYVHSSSIVPGSYAVVGAAAFSGAVTHTISTSVILFEMTGQIVHIIPVILGVLVANAVCQSLQPSIYDSIIEMKKLPYLPPIASSNSVSHRILVKDFMNTKLAYVSKEKFTYAELKSLLIKHKKLTSFPLIESTDSMKLLGSVPRPDLLKLLYTHLGRERRLQEVYRRNSDVQSPIFSTTNSGQQSLRISAEDQGKLKQSYSNSLSKEEEHPKKGPKLELASSSSSPSSSSSSSPVADGVQLSTDSKIIIVADKVTANDLNNSKTRTLSISLENAIEFKDPEIMEELIDGREKESSDKMNHTKSDQAPSIAQKSVAKIINVYDRGSTIDEDFLEKSNKDLLKPEYLEIEATVPELRVVVVKDSVNDDDNSNRDEMNGSNKNSNQTSNYLKSTNKPMNSPSISLKRMGATARPLSPLVELRAVSSFSQINRFSPQQSPSLSALRPKSILKTSSTAENLNNMYRKNMSSQDVSDSCLLDLSKKNNKSTGNQKTRFSVSTNNACDNNNNGNGLSFTLGDNDSLKLDSPIVSPVRNRRRVRLPRLRVVDMTSEEQEQWEAEQLNALIDISRCQVDEAPFQLVQQTSLYRVHTLFSMLGLNHAYVTSFGRLVGVVALKDIRFAIEEMLQEK